MAKPIGTKTNHATAHQIADPGLENNESSSDDSISLENYLDTSDKTEEKVYPESTSEVGNLKNEDQGDGVKLRPHVEAPIDNRTKKYTRESRKRRTLDEFLCRGGIGNEHEGGLSTDSKEIISIPQTPTQVANKVKDLPAQVSLEKTVEAEFKRMLENETQNSKDLVELFQTKSSIQNLLGKHTCADSFAILKELHGVQGWVVSHLDNICNEKSRNIEDLISKLCERQKLLSKYAQSVIPRVTNFTVKLQSKASSNFCKNQCPGSSKQLERLKECVKPDDPSYEIIAVAQEELLDISSDLVSARQAREPLKYSVLVEMRNPPNGERKLMSVFLFDNVLVCARQRVVVLRKHFIQDSDSDTASISANAKDQSDLVMNAKTISRYEVKWFIPLEQLNSLDSKGIAFDEEYLLERLQKIETLKRKIVKARQELQEETSKLDKEQAELVLQAPKLPLFISAADGQRYCLLMASEKERIAWGSAIMSAKAACRPSSRRQSSAPVSKRNSIIRPFSAIRDSRRTANAHKLSIDSETSAQDEILKNELSHMINHCKTAVPLSKLGKVIISGKECFKRNLGGTCTRNWWTDRAWAIYYQKYATMDLIAFLTAYYVAIEVDFYGQFELVAKTKSINTKNPRWDQVKKHLFLKLRHRRQFALLYFDNQLFLDNWSCRQLEEDQLDQKNASHSLKTNETTSEPVYLQTSILYNEREKSTARSRSTKQSDVFGQPLEEVLKRDQADRERLKKQIGGNKNYEELRVPVLVTACVEEIERRGLQEEGIYRICGAITTVSRLQDLFDRDTSLAVKQIGDYDINVISSLLKIFFRELPEPVIPTNSFGDLVKASAYSDETEKLAEFSRILQKMPRVNLDTFRYLMDHLIRVCQYESDNKMNLGNLSVIWAMTLFQPETMSAPQLVPSTTAETSDAKNAPSHSLQSATSASMLQTMVLGTVFDAYANGNIFFYERTD
ncbi:Active breakpoint cluster region-related protein [Echinococcus granulosus]|uniref:Active breakpoint cluster region-related protein n=1 Tax=Echinococcus granulosus TaxID=6210 RepID=W6UP83_ECHGR|nr:Active breakpoint cluster region-related protein [Echinococcus granulosus]EUB63058.1 Active breakpoint cluster region-related protein [Echinococcus granulosus]